jgi:hypothetical protein
MPVLLVADLPGGTAEQDDAIVKALGLADDPPKGARMRLADPTDSGWRIVSLWDTQEDFDAFRAARLNPTLEQQGRPAAPTPEFWPIETVIIYP